MSIATTTGDNGTTSLMYGRRVIKSNDRITACGDVDELSSALGLARALIHDDWLSAELRAIQDELIILMGELSVAEEDRQRYESDGFHFVNSTLVERLTQQINDLEREHQLRFHDWVIPGGSVESAALDVARAVCRRAERQVMRLENRNPEIVRYLNRLSDLCWLFARLVESRAP